jgi:hypothetical protein
MISQGGNKLLSKIGGILKSKTNNYNLIGLRRSLKEQSLSGGDLIIAIGRSFLGAQYAARTLETPGEEELIINFAAFDCTTFVETVLALTRCVAAGKLSQPEFQRTLQLTRYRGGAIDGYASRLHYFTDWLRDNEKKKILKDITRGFDAERQRKKINYMTTHREAYAALRNEGEYRKMFAVEKKLSRKVFNIIGKDKVNGQIAKIQNGDIIAFTTDQAGLDVAHVGFASWQGKNLHLLHASSKEGGVVISKRTLISYLKQNKKYPGIIIARPL